MNTAGALPSRLIGVSDRVPSSLSQLAGPADGRVSLPSLCDLEVLGSRHTAGFSVEELADRLGAASERDDRGVSRTG